MFFLLSFASPALAQAEVATTTPQVSTPLSALLGPTLHALHLVEPETAADDLTAELHQYDTSQALEGVDVVGLYFSAEWCGPCKQFTPILTSYQEKVNKRGRKLQVVLVPVNPKSFEAYAQYFASMEGFLSLPFEDGSAAGELANKYNVKGVPTLVLVDGRTGKTITKEGKDKVMGDKGGMFFPYAPLSSKLAKLVTFPYRVARKVFGGTVKAILKVFFNVFKGLLGMK